MFFLVLLVFCELSAVSMAGNDHLGIQPVVYYVNPTATVQLEPRALYFDERAERALLQAYLSQILDWNWRLAPLQHAHFCQPRMAEIEAMTKAVSPREFFYENNPNHMRLIADVSRAINREQGTAVDALTLAACMRDVINTKGWLRGLFTSLAIGRSDLRGFYTRPLLEIDPSQLVPAQALRAYRAQADLAPQERVCVPVNGLVGVDNGDENLLWYWREDVMVNSFHWYWHLVNPFMAAAEDETPAATAPDRRGELFYFVHHALVARYRVERMAVGLPELNSIELLRGMRVDEGYNSHLTDTNSGRNWTPRQAGRILGDVQTRAVTGMDRVARIEPRLQQLAAIEDAIQLGVAMATNGTRVSLLNSRGIDILGDMVEAAMWTLNEGLYGFPGPHNDGHFLLGLIEDADGSRNRTPGVMADVATAMRDPVFYRHHLSTDAIFNRHKRTLFPYQLAHGEHPLLLPGTRVLDVGVHDNRNPVNTLETFFVDKVYEVGRGLDFNGTFVDGSIQTCVHHLDHHPFNYNLLLESETGQSVTVRIYIAPTHNQFGEAFNLEDQRQLFFPLDRFAVELAPGLNRISRPSSRSSLTIPFPQSYTEFQTDTENETPICGCGWPQHLLLPRGTTQGQDFHLVVMLTAGEDLSPEQPNPSDAGAAAAAECRPASIFCGIVGQPYPDSKPMGYPFDRLAYDMEQGRYFQHVEEWAGKVPNIGLRQVRIFHSGDGTQSASDGGDQRRLEEFFNAAFGGSRFLRG